MAVRWEGSSTKMEQGEPEIERNQVSFPRWGKRNVVSFRFTELFLKITEIRMLLTLYRPFHKNSLSGRIRGLLTL